MNLLLAQFKSNQGLSNSDLCRAFNQDLATINEWLAFPPKDVSKTILILNKILEMQRLKDMPDIDRQQFEHKAELLVKENNKLKAEIIELKKGLAYAARIFPNHPSFNKHVGLKCLNSI